MPNNWHLFERFGVELEYMIVDAGSLDVRPIADKIVHAVGKGRKNEVKHGSVRWSNELVLHVIELKTDGPVRTLKGLGELFQNEVRYLNGMLAEYAGALLPTAMHPWMNPDRETRLWPHGDREIYQTFDRIFDCRGHGWSNLQSTHLNLPFSGDAEFRRLHTAIRMVLPLLPALAASSPYIEAKRGPHLDMRLDAYRNNCARIPSITGTVTPEQVESPSEYQSKILDRIYRDLEPHDPDTVLRSEWVNARGAIARFERNAIEIRVLDIQETPRMDLDILEFILALLRCLIDERWSNYGEQAAVPEAAAAGIFNATVTQAGNAVIEDAAFLKAFGRSTRKDWTAASLLKALLAEVCTEFTPWRESIEFILKEGCLARRIVRHTGENPNRADLKKCYERLAQCLQTGERFGE